jgi:hypothetical protein
MRDDDEAAALSGSDSGQLGPPRWVRWSLIVLAVVAAAVLIGSLLMGGQHGPGRHLGAEPTTPAAVGDAQDR